jgi:hypothetical protein
MDFGQKQPLTALPPETQGVTKDGEKVVATTVTVGSPVFVARLG